MADEHEAVHSWFGLTYANYLVVPRSILQSMPDEWQQELVSLLEQAQRHFADLDWPRYRCHAVDDRGRFRRDPIPHYNRGRTRLTPAAAPAPTRPSDPAGGETARFTTEEP